MSDIPRRVSVLPVCPDCSESDHCFDCWCCDGSMDEFTNEGIPIPDEERPASERDVMQLLAALGLGTHDRPYSVHDVIHRELLPVLLTMPLPDCPTHAVCPNCREGEGHWTGVRFMPTAQSRAAALRT